MDHVGDVDLATAIGRDADRLVEETSVGHHYERAIRSELEEAAVAGIGEIDDTVRGQRKATRTVEAGVPFGNLAAVGRERLDAMVPCIGDPDSAVGANGNAGWIAKLTRAFTHDAEGAERLGIPSEPLNASIAKISDDNRAIRRERDSARFAQGAERVK